VLACDNPAADGNRSKSPSYSQLLWADTLVTK